MAVFSFVAVFTHLMKTQIALDTVRGKEDLAFACQNH